jgi:hypothetical protein
VHTHCLFYLVLVLKGVRGGVKACFVVFFPGSYEGCEVTLVL